jgi:hypothetical protein
MHRGCVAADHSAKRPERDIEAAEAIVCLSYRFRARTRQGLLRENFPMCFEKVWWKGWIHARMPLLHQTGPLPTVALLSSNQDP